MPGERRPKRQERQERRFEGAADSGPERLCTDKEEMTDQCLDESTAARTAEIQAAKVMLEKMADRVDGNGREVKLAIGTSAGVADGIASAQGRTSDEH